MEEIKNDGNTNQSSQPPVASSTPAQSAADSVQPTQPVKSTDSGATTTVQPVSDLQTPPPTAPKEELGTSAPAKKPRAPRKPAEPKKVAFSRTDDKPKGNTEELKRVDTDQKQDEQINTDSGQQQQQQREEQLRPNEQSGVGSEPSREKEHVDRPKESHTPSGIKFVAAKSVFARNSLGRQALERIRARVDASGGGWSKGRFK